MNKKGYKFWIVFFFFSKDKREFYFGWPVNNVSLPVGSSILTHFMNYNLQTLIWPFSEKKENKKWKITLEVWH